MVNAGASIEAFLKLDASDFKSGLENASQSVTKFKESMVDIGKSANDFNSGVHQVSNALQHLINQMDILSTIDKSTVTKFKTVASALENIATAAQRLSVDAQRGSVGMEALTTVMQIFETGVASAEVTINATVNQLKRLTNVESQGIRVMEQYKLGETNVQQATTSMSSSLKEGRRNLSLYHQNLREMAMGVENFNNIAIKSFKQYELGATNVKNATEMEIAKLKELEAQMRKVQILTTTGKDYRTLSLPNNYSNPLDTQKSLAQSTAMLEQNSQAMRQNGAEILRNMGYRGKLSVEEERQTASTEKNTQSTQRNINAMNRQATASSGLRRALGSLRMMGTMVASMFAYNFAHKLLMATSETVHAKSEMNGYFQMLGYTGREVDHFNSKLDEMIQKFPRINKYALGETISSIGVEFELTTKEMEKAMPVVSMITSEYLRAGRNVNEASLAVKDILQGEFQRLSRETGVKGDQLKEAGWSGDKSDVMGLLKALKKVGEDRNWDVFVAKANSLNDAVMILQNRFGEWSADMVERIQPSIVRVFNSIMSVASTFGSVINGALDWLGGEGIGQDIVKWGALATAIIGGSKALVMYRTGANLTQIAQMGWRDSIIATVLGLEAETVAETDSYTAIVTRLTGLKASEVAQIGRTKALFASIAGLDLAVVKEHGLKTALLSSLTATEASTVANWGLGASFKALAVSVGLPLAVIIPFTMALGNLVMETMKATEKMSNFYDIQQNGQKYVDEAKDSVKNLKDHIKQLKETQKGYSKGTKEYKNVGKAIDDLNDKIDLANQNVDANYEALQRVNSAQKKYDTTKQELQLELQQKLNKSLVDTGLSTEEANELSNNYLNEAIDGSDQLYRALQSVAYQYDKQAEGVDALTKYWQDKGLTPEEIKLKIDPYIDSGNAIAEDIEKMKLSTDIIEVGATWGKLQIDQWSHSWDENLPKIEAGDLIGGLTGLGKGLAHFFADLPIFKDFWGWIFDKFNIKETYGGKGWAGLNQFLMDATNNLANYIWDFLKDNFVISLDKQSWGWDPLKDVLNYVFGSISDWSSSIEGFVKDTIGDVNIVDGILNAIFGEPVSASDGSSDHPSFMEDLSNIFGFNVQSWVTDFNNDPLGKLGIEIPQIDIIGLIQSLLPSGDVFNFGDWLSSLFDISGIVASFTTNIQGIVSSATSTASIVVDTFSGMFNGVKSFVLNIVSSATSGFRTVYTNASSSITQLRDSVSGAVHKLMDAFVQMKDSILNSAKKIQDGVKEKFDSVKDTIGGFYNKLTNPSKWFSGNAGYPSWSRTPKPQTARRLFSPVVSRTTGKHGAGINPYQSSPQVTLNDLVARLGGDKRVDLAQFLSLFVNSGFGAWDFHEPMKKKVFDTAKGWKADAPSWNGITMGNGYQVGRFWNGKPKFTWDDFMATAKAVFSAIPYKFYMDSDWKGDWLSALLSGATNCHDGSMALLALARLFGFEGHMVHTNLKNGVGHFFVNIAGHNLDTTNFQNNSSWKPLGGAGIPVRHSNIGGGSYATSNKNTTINVEISGNVYGVDDLESKIEEGVKKGLRAEFNDPYTVAI